RRRTALQVRGSGGRCRRPAASSSAPRPCPGRAARPLANPGNRRNCRAALWCDCRRKARGARPVLYCCRPAPARGPPKGPRARRRPPQRHKGMIRNPCLSHLTFPAAFSSPQRQSRAAGRPTAHVQIKPIPDSTAPPMEQADQPATSLAPPSRRAAAFGVHIFTALGAGIALLALLEAVREHWAAMFAWLGVAAVI